MKPQNESGHHIAWPMLSGSWWGWDGEHWDHVAGKLLEGLRLPCAIWTWSIMNYEVRWSKIRSRQSIFLERSFLSTGSNSMPILGQASRNDQHYEGSTALLSFAQPAQYDAYDTVTTGHQLKTDWSRSNGPWQVRVVSRPERSYEHSGRRNKHGRHTSINFYVTRIHKMSLDIIELWSIGFNCGLVDVASISVTRWVWKAEMCYRPLNRICKLRQDARFVYFCLHSRLDMIYLDSVSFLWTVFTLVLIYLYVSHLCSQFPHKSIRWGSQHLPKYERSAGVLLWWLRQWLPRWSRGQHDQSSSWASLVLAGMLGKAEWTVRKNKNKVISMCFTMHSAPMISRNVNDTVSILYILFYIDIQNDSHSFFLIVMDVLQIDLGLGLPGIFQVPGVGFNDVVIETPFHNMCAALEQEECLGPLHFFLWGGRLHAPCFFLEMPWVVHQCVLPGALV